MQDLNNNQLKLEVQDSYKKDEKKTNFEAGNDEDVINKAYLDETIFKKEGRLSFSEKDYNEFKLQYKKQSVEELLIQKGVKTTIQILYDEGLIDNFANADEVLKDFMFTTKRRPDLEKGNDVIQ